METRSKDLSLIQADRFRKQYLCLRGFAEDLKEKFTWSQHSNHMHICIQTPRASFLSNSAKCTHLFLKIKQIMWCSRSICYLSVPDIVNSNTLKLKK